MYSGPKIKVLSLDNTFVINVNRYNRYKNREFVIFAKENGKTEGDGKAFLTDIKMVKTACWQEN